MEYIKAKSVSYGNKRDKKSIKYIVIHYTGNKGDTARNNALYFANSNTRSAGAHFFVGRGGQIIKSIAMNLTAWSVGGLYDESVAAYYGKCTNANSVSIELCDIATHDASEKQIAAVRKLIKYIQKHCPNAKTIIRHYDVNGKACPLRYIEKAKWEKLKAAITP